MSIFQDPASLMQQARKQLQEKAVNPYAVGMAAAMKQTGDKPPLEKSTITKAHKIAKKVEKAGYEPEGEQIDEIAPLVAAGLLAAPVVAGAAAGHFMKKTVEKGQQNPNRRLVTGGTVGDLQRARQGESVEIINHLIDNGFAETEQNALKIMENMSESWMEEIVEARRSEKEGKGSPESPLSYPGRKTQKERGEKGGRHQYSGSQEYGGAAVERGRKKSDPQSQSQRLRRLSTHPEQPGKYSKMQNKKRDLGSRYD